MKYLYTIFDGVAEDSLAPFVANNDDHAMLMVKNSIKSHQFDRLDLTKCELIRLCSFDTDYCTIDSKHYNHVVYLEDLLDSDDKQQMYLEDFFKELNKTFSSDIKKALEDLSK